MFLIRKILKENLRNINATDDIILSITDTQEIFVNGKDGVQMPVREIIPINTIEEMGTISPIIGKFYFIKENGDIRLYVSPEVGFVSIKDSIQTELESIKESIKTNLDKINETHQEINSFKDQIEKDVDEKIAALNETIASLSDGIAACNTSINGHNQLFEGINSSISRIDADIAQVRQNASDAQELAGRNSEAITDLTRVQTDYSAEVTNIKSSIETINNNYTVLGKSVEDNTKTIEELNTVTSRHRAVYDVMRPQAGKQLEPIFLPEVYTFEGYDLDVNQLTIIRLDQQSDVTIKVDIYNNYTSEDPDYTKEILISKDATEITMVESLGSHKLTSGKVIISIVNSDSGNNNHIIICIDSIKNKINTSDIL